MKILHIIDSFKGGGAEKLTLELHDLYLKQGIDSYAVSLESFPSSLPTNTYSLGVKSSYKIMAFLKLLLFLSNDKWQDLDVIHVHLFPAQLYVSIIVNILRIKTKLVTTEHSTFNYRRSIWWGKFIDNLFYRSYVKVACISSGTLTNLLDFQPCMKKKLTIIYNGINLSNYSPSPTSSNENKNLIILSVGRLVECKNYEIAIRAFSKIANSNIQYWIVGSGDLELKLKNLAKSLNLEDKVIFLGFREDIPNILHKADIFLQTSLWEGFGLAVLEGMAAGLPVVASNVSGIREVVTEKSEAGFLIDPTSEADIADKLNQLINNHDLRFKMGRNAQKQAAKFDIHQTVQQYLDLYHSVCENEN